MPNLRSWPARWPIGLRPTTERHDLASGQTFRAGDLIKKDGNDDIIAVTGTDPTDLYGISAEDAENVAEPDQVMVYAFEDSTHFAMSGTRDPLEADVGTAYGIKQDGDNIWIVDLSDTSNTRVTVNYVDMNRDLYFVQVLSAHRQ